METQFKKEIEEYEDKLQQIDEELQNLATQYENSRKTIGQRLGDFFKKKVEMVTREV